MARTKKRSKSKTPKRRSERRATKIAKCINYEHLEEEFESEAAVLTTVPGAFSTIETGTQKLVPSETADVGKGLTVTEPNEETHNFILNITNIKMNNFVLNRNNTLKKKMDNKFKVIPREQGRQFKLEMNTPTYHIIMENFVSLGRKYGCSIKRDDVDGEGEKLRTQYDVHICSNGGKSIPISLTCYHTNNSMLVQLKKSEHSIEERKCLLESFITTTIQKIVFEVENSEQYRCVKEKLRLQMV